LETVIAPIFSLRVRVHAYEPELSRVSFLRRKDLMVKIFAFLSQTIFRSVRHRPRGEIAHTRRVIPAQAGISNFTAGVNRWENCNSTTVRRPSERQPERFILAGRQPGRPQSPAAG